MKSRSGPEKCLRGRQAALRRFWVPADPQRVGDKLRQLLEAEDGKRIPEWSGSISRKGKMNYCGHMPFYFVYSYSLHSVPFLFFCYLESHGEV